MQILTGERARRRNTIKTILQEIICKRKNGNNKTKSDEPERQLEEFRERMKKENAMSLSLMVVKYQALLNVPINSDNFSEVGIRERRKAKLRIILDELSKTDPAYRDELRKII